MADTGDMIYPQTIENWPWKRQINPHYEEIKAQSDSWLRSFNAFTPRSQYAFDKCKISLLASLSYPRASKEHLRTGCDLMNLYFVIDAYTDVETASAVKEMVDIVKDALKNPQVPRPQGEILLGEMARQFWELAIKTATPTSQHHFLVTFEEYLDSLVDQAEDRDKDLIRTIDSYLITRRENIGARSSFVIFELGLDLPDEVVFHPFVMELTNYICEIITIDNDLGSYNKEQATGDDRCNILTVIMHHLNTDLKGAVDWAAKLHQDIAKKFLEGLDKVPSFGSLVDEQLKEYIHGMGNWPRSNDCWIFESGRYFGDKGLEIQKSRIVPLLPKVLDDMTLKREQVVVPLVEI